jgi:hypothetical protein
VTDAAVQLDVTWGALSRALNGKQGRHFARMGYPFNRSRVASTAGSVEGAPGLEDARVSAAALASWPWGLWSA